MDSYVFVFGSFRWPRERVGMVGFLFFFFFFFFGLFRSREGCVEGACCGVLRRWGEWGGERVGVGGDVSCALMGGGFGEKWWMEGGALGMVVFLLVFRWGLLTARAS